MREKRVCLCWESNRLRLGLGGEIYRDEEEMRLLFRGVLLLLSLKLKEWKKILVGE